MVWSGGARRLSVFIVENGWCQWMVVAIRNSGLYFGMEYLTSTMTYASDVSAASTVKSG